MPDIQSQIFEAMGEDVMVIGLNPGGLTGNDAAYVEAYLDNLGITFPVYMDLDSTYGGYTNTLKIAPFPLDVVVNSEGEVTLLKRDFDINELIGAINAAAP